MQLANESLTDVPLPPTNFHPSGVAQAVNVLWFSSLILSLFAALFGIFVKQWLNTYSNWNDIADPRKAVLVRDMYSRGLKVWHVPNILATLPLLLQLALLFFVAGLVTYLWTVDVVVAGFLSVLVMAGLAVAVVAIVLPVFFDSCSYKSPLGLLLVRVLKSNSTSWKDRDLDVLKGRLPDNEDTGLHAYNEVCALVEVAPEPNELLLKKELVATRIDDLEVHADKLLFKLLRTILSAFAHSSPSGDRPEMLQGMLHVLDTAVRAGKTPMGTSVIQGFVKHVVESGLQVPDSRDDTDVEPLSSIHALASCICRHRTFFNVPGLADSATQLRCWWQQRVAISLDDASGNNKCETNRHSIVDGLLQQRSILNHPDDVNCAAFSRDGSRIVSGSDDGIVRVWDTSTGKVVQELKGQTASVQSVAFSPDGTRIVSGSHDQTVRVWDADSGAELRKLEGHTGYVLSVAFSLNGTHIVSGSADETVRVWDADSGAELRTLEGHTDVVWSVAFSPNGTCIVSGSADQTVRVWDADSGAELRKLEGHTSYVMSVAFSPNGTRIVSGSWDQTVRVWDADSGAELRKLEGHSDWVQSVAFSLNGTRIVSGSHDQTVRVWDADSGAELKKLEGHTGYVLSVAFSPDGTSITCQTHSGASHTWTAPHDFPLPTSTPLPPSAPPSPIFTLDDDSGWILGQKDPHSPSRRLFWVVPERRGDLSLHGHRVLLSSGSNLTLLDFKGVI
jgi:WD40 repeat protein